MVNSKCGKLLSFLLFSALLLSVKAVSGQNFVAQPEIFSFSSPEVGVGSFGGHVAVITDINEDNVSDFAITAAGQVYIYSGTDSRLFFQLALPDKIGGAHFGSSVADAGDVNADGTTDIIVGAYGVQTAIGIGKAYVFSGTDGSLLTELSSPNSSREPGRFGDLAISGLGDTNQDGSSDIAVGAWAENPSGEYIAAGRVHVFNGADGRLLYSLTAPNERRGGAFGVSMSSIADISGDGIGDLLVGSQEDDDGPDGTGAVYAFSGSDGRLLLTLTHPDGKIDSKLGAAVTGIPDINEDQIPDIVAGAKGISQVPGDFANGEAYVFSGLDGSLLFRLQSPHPENLGLFGFAVSPMMDLNNDSFSEIVVAAPGELRSTLNPRWAAGRVYVFSGFDGSLLLELLSPNNSEKHGFFGLSMSHRPVQSKAGLRRILIGAPSEKGFSGRAHVFSFNAPPAVTFFSTDDAQVKHRSPQNNYALKPTAKVEKDKFTTYLKFAVTGMTQNITSARVRLQVAEGSTDGSNSGGSIHLVPNNHRGTKDPWTQWSLNFSNAPEVAGTSLDDLGPVEPNQIVEFNVTSAIIGNGTYSFAITSASDDQVKYFTREGKAKPALIIEYATETPLPPPVAVNDKAPTKQSTPIRIDVTGNDFAQNSTIDVTTVKVTTPPNNGSAAVDGATGVVTYTPNSGFVGVDSLKYTVRDKAGVMSNEATVWITVFLTVIPPIAGHDNALTNPGISVAIDVTANDFAENGSIDVTTVKVTAPPIGGAATVDGTTGVVTYKPKPGFVGVDSLEYRVRDKAGVMSNEATVTIDVIGELFTDVTTQLGVGDAGSSHGLAWGDYDNDGDLDLVIANYGSENTFYRNEDGKSFVEIASQLGLNDSNRSLGVSWGDFNNDGWLDLYLANDTTPNRLYQNVAGTFTEVGLAMGVSDNGDSYCGVWGDYDGDGDLDLYVVNFKAPNRLYRNDQTRFTDVAVDLDVVDVPGMRSRSAQWVDYDNDGDLDLSVANFDELSRLYQNDGGNFKDVAGAVGIVSNRAMAVEWADFDNDGDYDCYLVVRDGLPNKLYSNDAGSFTEVAAQFGVTGIDSIDGNSASWGDYDNDGDLDLFLSLKDAPNLLYRNDGSTFREIGQQVGLTDIARSVGVVWGDYDQDGDLDLYVANRFDGPSSVNRLYRNDVTNNNHWLTLNLVGTQSNRSAIGANVRVIRGNKTQLRQVSGGSAFGSQNSLPLELGLGISTVVDSIEIEWPSGVRRVMTEVGANQYLTVVENIRPTAVDDFAGMSIGHGISIRVVDNDFDTDGSLDLSSLRITGHPSHGLAEVNTQTEIQYIPEHLFAGNDTVRYKISDNVGASSNEAIVVINIKESGGTQPFTFLPTDDAQVKLSKKKKNYATKTTAKVEKAKFNTYLKFDVTGLSGSVKSAKLQLTVGDAKSDGSASGGSVHSVANSFLGSNDAWTQRKLTSGNAPAIGNSPLQTVGAVSPNTLVEFDVTNVIFGNGAFSFALTSNSSDQVKYYTREGKLPPQLIIEVGSGGGDSNQPPVAFSDSLFVEENVAKVFDPLANDQDTDGTIRRNSLTVTKEPLNGIVQVNPHSGIVTFTPNQDFTGLDSFKYRVQDNEGLASNEATVAIRVGGSAPAETLTFDIVSDAYVRSTRPTRNHGSSPELRVRQSKADYNIYLKFKVENLTGSVAGARIRLHTFDGSKDGGTVHSTSNNFKDSTVPWDEATLIWNNAPDVTTGPLSAVGAVDAGQIVEFDVTQAMQREGLYSFVISSTSSNSARYDSKEGANPPQLIVETGGPTSVSRPVVKDLLVRNSEVLTPELLPQEFSLDQNYPNPFNPETTIRYALPEEAHVTIQIFNLRGQLVRTLVDREEEAGFRNVRWAGKNDQGVAVSSGIYFVRMNANQHRFVNRILLQK